MKILVINCGSSSLKFQLFGYDNMELFSKGIVERIGEKQSFFKHQYRDVNKKVEVYAPNHKTAFQMIIDDLLSPECGLLSSIEDIKGVGHRVVHGGEKFTGTVLIDDAVIEKMKECIPLAPLHNPPNLMGIASARELLPTVPMVGVFDTAFHHTLPKIAYLYALPYEYYEKYGVRRYGFHGTSHKYVSLRIAEILNVPIEELKIVTCHLGNGASMTAIKDGISVDTTMGMTPLEGLPMGTRSGDFDPAIILFLMEKEGLSIKEMDNILNKKSGVLGISRFSNDFRDLEDNVDNHEGAKLSLDIYIYKIKKYIGAYAAAMGGITDIIFTGGIGENSPYIRNLVCKDMEFLGVKIDPALNDPPKSERTITFPDSKVRVWIIPTNEELMIARETRNVIENMIKVG